MVNSISKQFEVSDLEFTIICNSVVSNLKFNTELLSDQAKQFFDQVQKYKTSYGANPPIDFLEGLCGKKFIPTNYDSKFLTDQLVYEFLQFKLKYLSQQAQYLSHEDPKSAFSYLQQEVRNIGIKIDFDMSERIYRFSDYAVRLARLKSGEKETDPIIKTRCNFGLPIIDDQTHGLCEGDFVLIAGQTNEGKSWLTKKIATDISLKQHKKVLMIILEEDERVAIHLVDSIFAKMDSKAYMMNNLPDYEKDRVLKQFEDYENLDVAKGDVIIPDANALLRSGNLMAVVDMCTQFQADVVFIDQITLISKSLEYYDMSDMGLQSKVIAKTMGIPVVGVAQAKKEPKSIFEVGYEVIAHSEELSRNADTIIYVAPDKQCLEFGVKYLKLLKTRRGQKDIVTRNRWNLSTSDIDEIGTLNPDEGDTTVQGYRPKIKRTQDQGQQTSRPDSGVEVRNQRSNFSWANV